MASTTGTTPFNFMLEGVVISKKIRVEVDVFEKMLPELSYAVLDVKVMLIRIAMLLPSMRNAPPLCVSPQLAATQSQVQPA